MTEIFADSGYFIALLLPRDQHKNTAMRAAAEFEEYHVVTTEMVLVETFAASSRQGPQIREAAINLLQELRNHPKVTIIPQTPEQFAAAAQLFAQRLDQRFSLTDCASFLAMEERGITQALTFDIDFRAAGFTTAPT
ncbi:MAG: PIN domain-containing protein [Chloroflexi bacterium]|nr:PIN domain-containing protein [Chloroflexota bacterium]